MTQPANFNHFEPFCAIKLFSESMAPYAEPRSEVDHLFSVPDFFDYLTDTNAPKFALDDLRQLPDGTIHNFTQNGSIGEFTYLTAEGREFVISGFSIVRHDNAIHWSVLGGEVLSDAEWQERCDVPPEVDLKDVLPEKRPFLAKSVEESDGKSGTPMPLEGTQTAVRTIIAGETDLDSGKHVARCYMTELTNGFVLFCDDPEIFMGLRDISKRNEMIATMRERVESAAVMWNLAEAFFQLLFSLQTHRFETRYSVERPTRTQSTQRW